MTESCPYEFIETTNGCIVRLNGYRRRFHVSSLVILTFIAVICCAPLVAAGVFLAGQVFDAPWHLLLLAGLFIVQVSLVGPVALVLRLLYREWLTLGWTILFACFGHHDLEVTEEWITFGERVGPFGNFLQRGAYRRVPGRAIQQIIVVTYREEGPPSNNTTTAPEDGKTEERFPNPFHHLKTEGNGELAMIEKPGGDPFTYYSVWPTGDLMNLAAQLHRHISRSQPSLPPVALIDKPAAAVREEWEALGREARAALEGPMPAQWWQRKLWLRVALVLSSLVGLVALLRLIWGEGIDVGWRFAGLACVLVEIFVVYFEVATRARQRARTDQRMERNTPP